MINNDYLKDIIEDEQERQAIYKKGEEREEKWEKQYANVLEKCKLNRQESNRKALGYIAVGLAAAVAGTCVIGITINVLNKDKKDDEVKTMMSETDEDITLTQNYEVVFLDNLTTISNRTGISVEDIQRDNNIANANKIYVGQRLELNYSVSPEDLKYYTESISVEGKYISQIAGEYNTTIKTLCDLNKESIINNGDGTYTIISDTILVPNFITPAELREAKGKGK